MLNALLQGTNTLAPFAGAGEIAAVGSAFAWSFGSVFYALAFKQLSPVQVAWFKNVVAGGILAFIAVFIIGFSVPLENLTWLALSGLLGLGIGDWLYFLAISHIGIGRTVIISQAVPAFTALLAWPIFGATLSAIQIAGIALVIIGGIVAESRRFTNKQESNHFDNVGLIAALACAGLWVIGNLAVAKGVVIAGTGETLSPFTGAAIRLASGGLFFAAWFIKEKSLVTNIKFLFRLDTWKLLAFPTLFGACFGMYLNVSSYTWTSPGVAASLTSTVPLFAIPLSAWLLHEKPGKRGWTGAGIVIIGALLVGGAIG